MKRTSSDVHPATASHGAMNHALSEMNGLVMGVIVRGKPAAAAAQAGAATRRALRLLVRPSVGGSATKPYYAFSLQTGGAEPPPDSGLHLGPPLVLTRGEPTSITVVNELDKPTAVHWHGIELESYYDGVAGFAGSGTKIAPVIEPGGSFDARFTPPRSGTFIYHTHVDEMRQQQAGLNGALIVVDDPAKYDRTHDIILLISVPRKAAQSDVVYLNGSATPAPLDMRVGDRYRLRFINIHVFRPSMRMRLLNGDTLATWRAVAKDGMDLPLDQSVTGPAEVQMGNGETYDFEYSPTAAGNIHLDITNAGGDLLTRLPVTVKGG
jgi:FtsP/CotA-like multicopper oxidase with cupredoxin domain